MTAAVKRVLVTGASEGGLGWALAKAFRDKGCLVVAAVRNRSKVQTAASYGIEVVEMDVTDTASIQDAARLLSEQDNGGLDILVNNAGVCKSFNHPFVAFQLLIFMLQYTICPSWMLILRMRMHVLTSICLVRLQPCRHFFRC